MTEIRHFAGWLCGRLSSIAGLVAVAGALALSGCGGGSGAPNNVFNGTVAVTPTVAIAYSGMTSFLNITSGTGPYRATSSNSAVLPVAQNVTGKSVLLVPNQVAADTDVTITIQDLGPLSPVPPSTTAVITVRAAPLLNSFTITPNLADCDTSVCSGQTATAKVTVRGPQGGLLAGRAVRFDVIGSSYGIVTNNPAQPLASSLTVVSDSTGTAAVIVKANVNAPSQVAQMSVTDVSSGQQLVGNFTIAQVTDGSKILSVVPSTVTIKGAFKGACSTGFATDYYIYGGTPPYRISSTFPNSITLVNSVVNANGGFFRAITNGSCVDPLTFSIVDATGRQTTADIHNVEGTEDAPAPADFAISPSAPVTSDACTGNTFRYFAFNGAPPYNVKPATGTAVPQTIATSGGFTDISGLTTGSGVNTILFLDSAGKSQQATITCSAANNVQKLAVEPPVLNVPAPSGTPPTGGCSSLQPFGFVIFGGTAPYSVTTSRGTASAVTMLANGSGQFTVSGLSNGSGVTSVVVFDSSTPQQNFPIAITCN